MTRLMLGLAVVATLVSIILMLTVSHAATIEVNTKDKILTLYQDDGETKTYKVAVARPGFAWKGEQLITQKAKWPAWTPPSQMLKRRPNLPKYMPGGPNNPLGARALYLGNTLYRIHGNNEPESIGQAASSGCIRMFNDDIIELYEHVPVGTRVIVY